MGRSMWLGVAVIALAATCFLAYLAKQLYDSEKSFLAWPTTAGQITSISIVKRSQAAVSGTATSATHSYWRIEVNYQYNVDGNLLAGDRLSTSPPQEAADLNQQPSEALKAYVQRYAVGTTVQVHYSTSNSAQSVLEINTGGYRKFANAALASLGLLILASGFAITSK